MKTTKARTIAIARFKAECLALLDEVARSHQELVVTRRGNPIARVVPLEPKKKAGKLRVRVVGDIVGPSEPEWNG